MITIQPDYTGEQLRLINEYNQSIEYLINSYLNQGMSKNEILSDKVFKSLNKAIVDINRMVLSKIVITGDSEVFIND